MNVKASHISRLRECDPAIAIFNIVLFVAFASGLIAALSMPFAQRMLPLVVCTIGCALSIATFLRWLLVPPKPFDPDAEEDVLSTFDGASEADMASTLRYGAWMGAYLVGLWALGLTVSTLIFTAAFLRIERGASVSTIALVAAITLGTAYALGRLLNVHWPPGFLPF